MFTLNPQSGIPIYRQLMEQIRRMVSSGQLEPGDELPSVRELALTHAVNPMTISKAYNLLEGEGLLNRARGKPMTITTTQQIKENKSQRLERLNPLIEQLLDAAKQLELEPSDIVDALLLAKEKDND